MNLRTRLELSMMMFLEFFVWGSWAVTMGTYLTKIGFDGTQVGTAYSTTAWAAIVSPFFVGMVADRFFDGEKVLGTMHLLGAVLMWYASTLTEPGPFFWVLLGYALCYMPTLALVNAISFNQMRDPQKEFPAIRVLGTLGWIVAGFVISFLMPDKAEETVRPLQMAAVASVIMGIYSFMLPKTPPKSGGKKPSVSDILGLPALRLLKDPSFAVFVLGSLLVCIPLAFYYNFANVFFVESGMTNSAAKQSMGQVSEVLFMLVMPLLFTRLGVKKMLLLGMLAWALRYTLFAFGNNETMVWMLYTGIILHGICYDFFFVTGQIYVDNKAPREIRANAQGFIALITYGAGMLIGNYVSGIVVTMYTSADGAAHLWRSIWLVPAGLAAVVVVLFAIAFRDNGKRPVEAAPAAGTQSA